MIFNKKIINLKYININDLKFLKHNRLYKSYAYALASVMNFETVDSFLILSLDEEILKMFANHPVQIRVDFKQYNRCKPMGGVTIFNSKILKTLLKRLLNNNFFPIITPDPSGDLSRYKNQYSINILLNKNNDIVIEVLGEGFDLSDLKRGEITPHETIIIKNKKIEKRIFIDENNYRKTIKKRKEKLKYLYLYELFVNKYGFMFEEPSKYKCLLNQLENNRNILEKYIYKNIKFLEKYNPLPNNILSDIMKKIEKMNELLNKLNLNSNNIVFSYSYSKKTGLILWDIYGDWYFR